MSAAKTLPPDPHLDSALPVKPASSKVLSDINNLEKRLGEILERDIPGSRISFGFAVLSSVARGHYDRATAELDAVGNGLEEYELFEFRARRFIDHAKSLVIAIRSKHAVGRSANVNKSKQKELSDRIAEHFVDLKKTIIAIEKIQKSVRSEDLGSTVYFFKTCFFSTLAVVLYYAFHNYYSFNAPDWSNIADLFYWTFPGF